MEQNLYRKEVGPGGRIVIPAKVREECGFEEGGEVLIRVVDGEAHLYTLAHAIRKAQEYFRQFKTPGRSVVDELIAERRKESRREEGDAIEDPSGPAAVDRLADEYVASQGIDLDSEPECVIRRVRRAFVAGLGAAEALAGDETEEMSTEPETDEDLREALRALEELQAGATASQWEELKDELFKSPDADMAKLIELLKDFDCLRQYVGAIVEECIRSADWGLLVLATRAVVKAQTGEEVTP